MGWKGHIKIFPYSIRHKRLSFPEKIVMMGNCWDARFRYKLCNGYAQRYIKRYCQRILSYQKINFELLDEFVKMFFKFQPEFMDFPWYIVASFHHSKEALMDFQYIWMLKVGFRNYVWTLWCTIALTGKIKACKSFLFKDVSPFCCFKGNTVCSGKTGWNKSNIFLFISDRSPCIENNLQIILFI